MSVVCHYHIKYVKGLWQYGLWSFQMGDTKIKILPAWQLYNPYCHKKDKALYKILFWCIISSWLLPANNVLTLISTLQWGSKSYKVSLVFHVHLRFPKCLILFFNPERNSSEFDGEGEFNWYFKTKVLITSKRP